MCGSFDRKRDVRFRKLVRLWAPLPNSVHENHAGLPNFQRDYSVRVRSTIRRCVAKIRFDAFCNKKLSA